MSLDNCAPEILRQILAYSDTLTVSRWTYLNKTVSPVAVAVLYHTMFPSRKQLSYILAHCCKNLGFVRVLLAKFSMSHSLSPRASDWAQLLQILNSYKKLRVLEFKHADWQNNPAIHARLRVDWELFTPELWAAFLATLNLPSLERVTIPMNSSWCYIPTELVPRIMNCGAIRDLSVIPIALRLMIPVVDPERRSKLQTLRIDFGQGAPVVDRFCHLLDRFILDSLKRLSFQLYSDIWPEEDFLALFAIASQIEELSILENHSEWPCDLKNLSNFSIASLTCLRHLAVAFIVHYTYDGSLGADVLNFPLHWIIDRILSTIPSSIRLESLRLGFRAHNLHQFYDEFHNHPEWRRLSELLDDSPPLRDTNVMIELCGRFPGAKEFTFETHRIAEYRDGDDEDYRNWGP
ncbi:hypothetical protein DL96DRAFT_1585667, partial [Flagelloscypha sp. PMI_526]